VAKGSLLLTNNAQTGQQVPAPTMTYYHGSQARQFVFSGFAPWSFAREDCIALVDFVLQDLWGMTRLPVDRSPSPASLKGGGTTPVRSVTPSNRTANARGPASSPTRE
jgi:hypothetical protein